MDVNVAVLDRAQKYTVFVSGYGNDACYHTDLFTASYNDVVKIVSIVKAMHIKHTRKHDLHWDDDGFGYYADVVSKEDLAWFSEFVPYDREGCPVGTINEIKATPFIVWERIQ
jgi:hypothetical protein